MSASGERGRAGQPRLLDQDRMITSEELAGFLGPDFTVEKLDQLASRGGGPPSCRPGKRRMYHTADVKAWLLASRRLTTHEPATGDFGQLGAA